MKIIIKIVMGVSYGIACLLKVPAAIFFILSQPFEQVEEWCEEKLWDMDKVSEALTQNKQQ